MKKLALILIALSGLILPWACTNSQPTGPLATYNQTATFTNTFTPTPTNWAGYTSTTTPLTSTPTITPTITMTFANTATNTISPTITNTFINSPTVTNTPTLTKTSTVTNTATSTATLTPTVTLTPTATFSRPTPLLTLTPWNTLNGLPPNGLAYDGATTVYVAVGYENESNGQPGQIQMFNTSGTSFGTLTTYDGTHSFGQPNGVAYYGGNVYVVDQVNNAVYEINVSGSNPTTVLTSWAASGGGPAGAFLNPEGIAVDGSGNVYVADTGNDYVEEFNFSLLPASPLVAEFGGTGSGNGEFNNPSALAVDGSNNIYVVDAYPDQRVEIFSNSYAYSSQFSTGTNSDVYGITLDSTPNIYLADSQLTSGAGQVEEYNISGALQTAGLGGNNSATPDPVGLVFISANLLLVADYNNNQLYQMTP